jgi:hypothetical protein
MELLFSSVCTMLYVLPEELAFWYEYRWAYSLRPITTWPQWKLTEAADGCRINQLKLINNVIFLKATDHLMRACAKRVSVLECLKFVQTSALTSTCLLMKGSIEMIYSIASSSLGPTFLDGGPLGSDTA